MAHPLAKNSTGWSPATVGGRLCNQRLWDQENSSHRLAIKRGMWMPWTSGNLAAFHWLAWLAAHFFSLFGSHVPPLHSSFLAAHSSYAALPFPVSAGGGMHIPHFFPGSHFSLLLTTMPRHSLNSVSFQMFLAGLRSAIMLLLVYALLVLLLVCSHWKKSVEEQRN